MAIINGELTVAEVRDDGREEQIREVTGLTVATIRAKLRDSHGHTKLRNVFRQWPDRATELGGWTANFALQAEVNREISELTGVGPRVVKRRLEEAHGKTLVRNVFGDEWPPPESDLPVPSPKAQNNTRRKGVDSAPGQPSSPDAEFEIVGAELTPRSTMFRRYDLRRARNSRRRREPAAHQADALAKLHSWYRSKPTDARGGILALPTGGGKTFTTVRFLCQEPLSDGYKVLWLAHTHHLLEQALDAFGSIDPESDVAPEIAHIAEPRSQLDVRVVSGTPGHFPISTVSSADDVVIATLQTVVTAYNRGHEKLLTFLDSSEGKLVVVFDEAHHAPAPTYCKLLERFREAYPNLYLLGLTATPTYSDERRQGWLKRLFPQDVLFTVSRAKLMAAKVLSRPQLENRRTEITVELDEADYQRWLSSYGDLPEHIVSQLAENQQRNDLIADAYAERREQYGKTIIFADRWYQCDYLREALIKRGVRADVVYSHVDARLRSADERNRRAKDENAQVLHRFRNGELDVLVNVRMLTEGTDVPSVKTVFLTRQTTSSILLTQMIGRALRGPLFGGTADAFIVSFIDNWKQVISFADFDSLPAGLADDATPEYGRRPPLQLISIELVRRLARQMYAGGGATTQPFVTLLPEGWYRVEYQARIGTGDDIVWQRHLVMVFANEKGRYDAFIGALAAGELTTFASEAITLADVQERLCKLRDQYFAAVDEHPGGELLVDLFHIARHMGQGDGESPLFFKFEERTAHDVDAIAREHIDKNLGIVAADEAMTAEYNRADRFWRSLYSNYGLFCAQCQSAQRRILDARRHGVDSERHTAVVSVPEQPPPREPSESVKLAVFRRDGRLCCCCGSPSDLQVDHIVPYYLGGSVDMDQLQTLCRTCNSEKAINEINFRVSRTLLQRPPPFVKLRLPEGLDLDASETWLHYIQRTVNFFYRCAAVDTIDLGGMDTGCQVVLRHGIDPTWIEPHLGNFDLHLAELRAGTAFSSLGSLKMVPTVW